MGIFDAAFERASEDILAINRLSDIETFLRDVRDQYGLRHTVYHAVALPGINKPNPVLILTYPDDWVRHYIEKDYFAIDPVVATSPVSMLPVDWGTLSKRTPAARNLFGEAIEYKIGRQGLTIPIRGPNGDSALFSITSDAPNAEWQRARRYYARDFQLIGHAIHAKVIELSSLDPNSSAVPLSPRERECLELAAIGRTVADMEIMLGISERTARAYLDSARHKLNCLNRDHAIAKAVKLGLIQPRLC